MELVSIIIPIYNVEHYLERCVDSILKQTYSNIEIILVDDGSPDGCPQICDNYEKLDSRVFVVHKSNGGLSDARNTGLKYAKGSLIAFLDSDDWVAPSFIEIMVQTLLEQQADIVECEVIRTENDICTPLSYDKINIQNFTCVDALKNLIMDQNFHQYVWNKIYRKTVINNIEFPIGKCNEDEFWTYRIFSNAKVISKIEIPLYYYFQRPGSIMGLNYSFKRLDAIEAKIERQKYIDCNHPELTSIAEINLAWSILYAGQMSLKFLKEDEKKQAMKKLSSEFKNLNLRDYKVGLKHKIWFKSAQIAFIGTCKLRNAMHVGF